MSSREGYDVLRFIEHNQVCYVSSEYVEGSCLVKWLKYHPQIEKELLFSWMRAMVRQLAQFHKCRGDPCYQYVNPYSVVVTKERQIYFLDMGADSNAEELKRMQRRAVREYFLPPEEAYYQTASVGLDIYGLGRTIQYLLAECECEPELKNCEIIKLQKIISRCLKRHSKKSFQNVSDVQKYIPEYKPMKEKGNKRKRVLLLAATIAVLAAAGSFFKEDEKSSREWEVTENKKRDKEQQDEQTENVGEKESYQMELGLLYFLKLQDYEKSKECFEAVKNSSIAKNMAIVAESMSGGDTQGKKFRRALQELEQELVRSGTLSEEQSESLILSYYPCLIRGYACLQTEEEMKCLLRLGETYMSIERQDDTGDMEIMRSMAMAYEKTGQKEQAIGLYEQLIEKEEGKTKEELYKKMAVLYFEIDHADKSQEILRKGMEEFSQSAEIRIQYIKVQCQDSGVDREICRQTIEDTLKIIPELETDAEFQKLLNENGFVAEGGKVWGKE